MFYYNIPDKLKIMDSGQCSQFERLKHIAFYKCVEQKRFERKLISDVSLRVINKFVAQQNILLIFIIITAMLIGATIRR